MSEDPALSIGDPEGRLVWQLVLGWIYKVYKKPLCVDVVVVGGGMLAKVPFGYGGVDLDTKEPHGVFFPPREKQLVGLMFVEGRKTRPVCCFHIPIAVALSDRPKYDDILDDEADCMVCHFTGSRVVFRKDGSVEVNSKSGKKIKVGNGTTKKLLTETAAGTYGGHTHSAVGNLGIPLVTTAPLQPMTALDKTDDTEAS